MTWATGAAQKTDGDINFYWERPGEIVYAFRDMWQPGIYESEAAVRYSLRLPPAVLEALSDRICRVDGENRPIRLADLEELQ